MPSTINASNTTGGVITTGDGSGILQLQSGGTTGLTVTGANVAVAGAFTAVNVTTTGLITGANVITTGAFGVGASPSYGTSGQVLTSAGSGAVATWSTPTGISTGKAIAMAIVFGG